MAEEQDVKSLAWQLGVEEDSIVPTGDGFTYTADGTTYIWASRIVPMAENYYEDEGEWVPTLYTVG